MVGFAHSRKGIALKSGEYVNRSNFFSKDMFRWLYSCAIKVKNRLCDEDLNIKLDDLVNETWLKHSRYFNRVQTQGTKQIMYRYLQRNLCDTSPFTEEDHPMDFEVYDDFEELFAKVLSRIGDTETRFMLELYIKHGMSFQQIGQYFGMTRQGVEARIKRAVGAIEECTVC